jgi:hypothetical protein
LFVCGAYYTHSPSVRHPFSTSDLTCGNILIRESEGDIFELFLIDYEDIIFVQKVVKNQCLHNLSQVWAGMNGITENACEKLCLGYSMVFDKFDRSKYIKQVKQGAANLFKQYEKDLDNRFSDIGRFLANHTSNCDNNNK